MQPTTPQITSADVMVAQAAEVVTQAVQATAHAALRAADGCGCQGCRARASETLLWSVAMLHTEETPVADEPWWPRPAAA